MLRFRAFHVTKKIVGHNDIVETHLSAELGSPHVRGSPFDAFLKPIFDHRGVTLNIEEFGFFGGGQSLKNLRIDETLARFTDPPLSGSHTVAKTIEVHLGIQW